MADQDRTGDIESGEATPLLASERTSQDEDSAAVADADGALSPPPSCPPPPVPPGEVITSISNGHGDRNDSSISRLSNEDDAQSNRSGSKSSKSQRRRRKRKGSGANADAHSIATKSARSAGKKKRKAEGPQKSVCHLLFDFVRCLAVVASAMMLAMQVVPLVIVGGESTWLQIAVRSYLAIFCVTFILAELPIPVLRRMYSSQHWIIRGFLYSFIGLIGMEQDLAVRIEDIAAGTASVLGPGYATLFAAVFMTFTVWIMMVVGALYTVMGLFCLQGWYDRLEKEHREKVEKWKQDKKRGEDYRKQHQEYKQYEKDRREGRGEWYDDL